MSSLSSDIFVYLENMQFGSGIIAFLIDMLILTSNISACLENLDLAGVNFKILLQKKDYKTFVFIFEKTVSIYFAKLLQNVSYCS